MMDDLAKRRLLERFGLTGDATPKPEYERLPLREMPLESMANALKDSVVEIERLRAQLAGQSLELRKANIKLRDRAHPASEPRDPPEVLASLGFWPDCGCGECYAIHCLGNALAQLAARDRDAERYRWLRARKPGGKYRIAGLIYSDGDAHFDAAIDAAMAKAER